MGIQVLPNLENVSPTSGLHLVGGRDITARQPSVDLPFYDSEPLQESDHLGCVRGIAMALGIQAIVGIVGFALWELHFFIR